MVARIHRVLNKKWSMRLMVAIAILSTIAEALMPFIGDRFGSRVPSGVMVLLSGAVGALAWYTRIRAQREMIGDRNGD